MRLAYLLLANHAEIAPDGRLNLLGADFHRLFVQEVPAVIPFFYLVGKIVVEPHEVDQDVQFRFHIVDPKGTRFAQPQMVGTMRVAAPATPGIPAASGISVLIQNCEFGMTGMHKVIFQIGDLPQVEQPLLIELATAI